jgi:hypothetical protein
MARCRFAIPLAAVLVAVVGGATVAGGSLGGEIAATPDGVEPEQVVIDVALHGDGSATWTIEHRIAVDDPEARRGFERTRESLAENRSQLRGPFTRRIRAMATEAEEATGRVMVVENVSVAARRDPVQQRYGVIEYSFRWYGFAATDDRLRAGDALSGLFLDEKTTLLVSWPANATLAEVTPEPDERRDLAVVWEGPIEFAQGEPQLTVDSASMSFGPDVSFGVQSNDLLLTLAALGGFLGTVGVGVTVWRRRGAILIPAVSDILGDADATESTTATADQPAAESDETPPAETTEPSPPDETPSEAGTAPEPETADATEGSAETESAEDLLSNEERVLALLDERGGRMKQQEVVSELDWSETKTSEVVTNLRESEEIEVYRLGRENVLALPETGLGLGGEEE